MSGATLKEAKRRWRKWTKSALDRESKSAFARGEIWQEINGIYHVMDPTRKFVVCFLKDKFGNVYGQAVPGVDINDDRSHG